MQRSYSVLLMLNDEKIVSSRGSKSRVRRIVVPSRDVLTVSHSLSAVMIGHDAVFTSSSLSDDGFFGPIFLRRASDSRAIDAHHYEKIIGSLTLVSLLRMRLFGLQCAGCVNNYPSNARHIILIAPRTLQFFIYQHTVRILFFESMKSSAKFTLVSSLISLHRSTIIIVYS